MEEFTELIASIPDATSLLTPSPSLSTKSFSVLTSLTSELQEYLLIKNYDDEQIWGQLSLITKKVLKDLEFQLSEALARPPDSDSDLSEAKFSESESNIDSSLRVNLSKADNLENEGGSDEENYEEEEKEENQDFFDMDEMERFADEGEKEEEEQAFEASEEGEESESDVENPKYGDFYRPDVGEESEEEQEQIFSMVNNEEMDRIEEKLIAEKPWQLKGEISSKSRPKDSLLNEELDFELARNPAPQTQTKAVTDEIENIIKQRISDMVYDDVKHKIVNEKSDTRTAITDFMDYEKSKKSLAELYEDDFKAKVLHIPVTTETERAKKEITAVFRKLCYNLEMLSSMHPVPKPVVNEMQVRSANVPALVMEEVLPFAVNKTSLIEPQQVFDPKNAVLKTPEEQTKSDKNTVRKRHKATLRTRKKERILKLMNKMAQDPKAQKFEYRRLIKEEKAKKSLLENKKQPKSKFTKSSEFFKTMQNLSKEISPKLKSKSPPLSKKIKL
jgi:U3 small nucleolar RNA-associated protein MPP10